MANIQQIAQSLLGTLQGDTKSIKHAQQNLLMFSKDQSFLPTLLTIPQMQGSTQILNRAATIYTLTYVRNLVQSRNQANINIAAQHILSFISKNNIQFKYRDQVSAALEYLIQKDINNIIISAYVPNTLQMIKNTLQTPISQINIQGIVLISQVMADKVNPINYKNADIYVKQSFMVLCYLVKQVLEHGSTFMSTDEVKAQKVLFLSMKMLKVLKKYIKKFMYYDVTLVQVLYSQHYINMMNTVLTYNLPQNSLSIPIFYLNKGNQQQTHKIIQYFHNIKATSIYILSQSVRLIVNTKYSSYSTTINPSNSQILALCPQYITALIKSTDQLLQKLPYYKLNSKLQLKIIQQIYNYILICLRTCKYYLILSQLKPTIIFSLIFKTLALCPQDYTNYYNNPPQFVHSLLQIIQLDIGTLSYNSTPQTNQSQIDIQLYDTLKTNSANLLKTYIKYIDGTLAQIQLYIINILQDKINLQISKNLIYLIVCILRDQLKVRSTSMYTLRSIIYKNIRQLPLPIANIQQPYSKKINYQDIQYTLNLLVLTRYLLIFDQLIDQSIIDKTYQIIEKLLRSQKLQLAPRILASDLVYMFLKTEEGSAIYCKRIIGLYNQVLSTRRIQENYLECIVEIIKENGHQFKDDYLGLIQMIEKVSAFLVWIIKRNSKQGTNVGASGSNKQINISTNTNTNNKDKQKPNQKNTKIIHKLWHIIQQIVQNKHLVHQMADPIRRVLQPLLNMIDGTNQLQLQQKIYSIMQKIIKSTAQVGQFQLQILSILPKIFYITNNNRKYRLDTPYSLLQSIIFYGKQLLSSDLILTRSLILLCLQNISHNTINQQPRQQSDCLQGILLIQSLILSVGSTIFNQQIWITITRTLTKKILQINIIYDIIKGRCYSIVATLCLILSIAYKWFNNQDNQELIKLILKQSHNLNNVWLCKMYIIAMANLLQNYGLPFIFGRFNHVLDVTITLLKLAPELKVLSVDDKELDEEKRQFAKLKSMTINCFQGVDQYEYFKNSLYAIKESNSMILENAYEEFPAVKKGYLRDIMSSRKVNQQVRVIYKLKNKGGN